MATNPLTPAAVARLLTPVRKLRRRWIVLVDRIAALAGIWAMNRLFGGGCAPPYREGCVGCDAGRMVEVLKDTMGDAP